jgi:hypothetical protein
MAGAHELTRAKASCRNRESEDVTYSAGTFVATVDAILYVIGDGKVWDRQLFAKRN